MAELVSNQAAQPKLLSLYKQTQSAQVFFKSNSRWLKEVKSFGKLTHQTFSYLFLGFKTLADKSANSTRPSKAVPVEVLCGKQVLKPLFLVEATSGAGRFCRCGGGSVPGTFRADFFSHFSQVSFAAYSPGRRLVTGKEDPVR